VEAGQGRLATLPAPNTPLPREKPLPKARPLTKWEKFAQQKGIQKKKRSKLVYDEDQQEWRRRYGYKRAGDIGDVAVVDAKASDGPGFDPFSELRKEKKERVRANQKQREANLKAIAKDSGRAALPATVKLTAGALTETSGNKVGRRKHLRGEIGAASLQAGVSTASMGKFDRLLKGERREERQHKAVVTKRRNFLPVTDRSGAEREKATSIVGRILRERADDIVDLGRAMGQVESANRKARTAEKVRAFRDGDDGGRGKGKGKGGRVKGGKVAKGGKTAAGKGGKKGGKGKR